MNRLVPGQYLTGIIDKVSRLLSSSSDTLAQCSEFVKQLLTESPRPQLIASMFDSLRERFDCMDDEMEFDEVVRSKIAAPFDA